MGFFIREVGLEGKSYWLYVLELENGRRYVGQTNNLERRLEEHKNGKSPYTRKMGARRLIYSERHETRSKAMEREKYLKSGQGRLWLQGKLAEQSAIGG